MSKIKQKKKAIIKHSIDPENDQDDQLSYDSIDDQQYLNLLQGHVPKSHKVDINLGQKYQGKKTNNQQQDSESENDLLNESINSDEIPEFIESQQEESNDQEQRKIEKQKPKKQQNLSTFQKELQQIENEDLEMIEKQKENKKELKEVADQIKEQQQIWGNLIEIREQMQKTLDSAKRLPIQKDVFVKEIQRNVQIGKLKEMHTDLLVYEKKCDSLERDIMTLQAQVKGSQQNQERLEQEKQMLNQEIKQLIEDLRRIQNQYDLKTRDFDSLLIKHEQQSTLRDRDIQSLRSQNSTLAERNLALEHELAKEREKQLQLDSKIRNLENEIHNLNFQQTLKQQYSWNTELQLSIGNQKPLFTEVSQGYQSPQANYQGLNSPVYNQSGIQVQSNQKPTEVSNYGGEHQRKNSLNQIKSKNYDLRFHNQSQNQQH